MSLETTTILGPHRIDALNERGIDIQVPECEPVLVVPGGPASWLRDIHQSAGRRGSRRAKLPQHRGPRQRQAADVEYLRYNTPNWPPMVSSSTRLNELNFSGRFHRRQPDRLRDRHPAVLAGHAGPGA